MVQKKYKIGDLFIHKENKREVIIEDILLVGTEYIYVMEYADLQHFYERTDKSNHCSLEVLEILMIPLNEAARIIYNKELPSGRS